MQLNLLKLLYQEQKKIPMLGRGGRPIRCVDVRIQCLTAIFFFPGGQESSINSPYVPRMSHITRLLNVRFRLQLHLAAVL